MSPVLTYVSLERRNPLRKPVFVKNATRTRAPDSSIGDSSVLPPPHPSLPPTNPRVLSFPRQENRFLDESCPPVRRARGRGIPCRSVLVSPGKGGNFRLPFVSPPRGDFRNLASMAEGGGGGLSRRRLAGCTATLRDARYGKTVFRVAVWRCTCMYATRRRCSLVS